MAQRFSIGVVDMETNNVVEESYIGEEIIVQVNQTTDEGSFLNFYIQNCVVKLADENDITYELITGAEDLSCPDPFTEVTFQEEDRVQESMSSFSYRVFGFYGYDSSEQVVECTVKFCLVSQCPWNIGVSC